MVHQSCSGKHNLNRSEGHVYILLLTKGQTAAKWLPKAEPSKTLWKNSRRSATRRDASLRFPVSVIIGAWGEAYIFPSVLLFECWWKAYFSSIPLCLKSLGIQCWWKACVSSIPCVWSHWEFRRLILLLSFPLSSWSLARWWKAYISLFQLSAETGEERGVFSFSTGLLQGTLTVPNDCTWYTPDFADFQY